MFKKTALALGLASILVPLCELRAQTFTLDAVADTYLDRGEPDRNQGDSDRLRLTTDSQRILVRFDPAAVAAAVGSSFLVSAHLEIFVEEAEGWAHPGEPVAAHRLLAAWGEATATWDCAEDSDAANHQADCAASWQGGTFAEPATAAALVSDGRDRWLRLDVTADVAAFLAGTPDHGWLLRGGTEALGAELEVTAREDGAGGGDDDDEGNGANGGNGDDDDDDDDGGGGAAGGGPRLVLIVESPSSDAAGPRLAITQPLGRFMVNDPTPEIALSFEDGGSGVDPGSLAVTLDGQPLSCTAGSASATCEPPRLTAGAHMVTASLSDTAGNTSSASHGFELLLGPGTYTLDFPAVADTFIREDGESNRNFGAEAFLRVKHGGRHRSLVSFDGAELAGLVGQGTVQSARLLLTIESTGGSFGSGRSVDAHRLTTAWQEGRATWSCGRDLDLSNNQPDCDPEWNGGSFEATASASVLHTKNQTGTVTFNVTADVADLASGGTHHGWLVKKRDEGASGDVDYVSREASAANGPRLSVLLAVPDNEPPTISAAITPAPNGAGWHNGPVTVTFTCDDQLSGIATCPAPVVVTTEGADQVVTGTAIDREGNTASVSVTLDVDLTAPSVAIGSPADGSTVSDPQVSVTGQVLDPLSGLASATCNGLPLTLSGGGFSCVVSLAAGLNVIQIQALDVAGNTGSAQVTVTLAEGGDTTPPVVAITAPPSGSFVLEARPEIVLTLQDETALDRSTLGLTANGSALTATCVEDGPDGARCSLGQDLAEGTLSLGASVADLAGNLGSATTSFVVDTAGLGIAITSPQTGDVTRADQVSVSGTASSGVASVAVNGVPASISGGTFAATVPLREGVNTVVALATKTNGRTGTASIQVTRDVFAPIVRIDSPREGFVSVNDRVAVTGLVNDIVPGGAEATVMVNGVLAAVGGGAFLVDDLPLVRGPNTVEAVATDRAGNVGRHSIQVLYQPPVGARIALGSGNGQLGFVNADLPAPLVAVVQDELGNPVAGRLVRFEVTRNSGLVRAAAGDAGQREVLVPTDGSGRASVLFTTGDTAGVGTNRVVASAVGVAGEVELCATGLARGADKILMIMGDNQRGVAGAPLPTPLEVLVVDRGGNPIAGVAVTFNVVKGTGSLDGGTSQVEVTGLDGLARAVLTLGSDPGINNNVVAANFAGNTGLPATFTVSALLAGDPAATAFTGVVLDNALTPIPGAVVSADAGAVSVSAVTDAEGRFRIVGVPVGAIHLHIDPTGSPRPETYPPLAFETVTVAGQENDLGRPILIPALDTSGSKIVGGPQDVTLTMAGVAGLSLTVFANSVRCPDGSSTCRVTLSQVHQDKVPMPPPSGTLFMPPAWTIQPHGVEFDPPARITLPNNGLPPGRMIDIYQFDHALNRFVNVGKGTVSEDASIIVSDPGFGITRAGWGGGGPPPPPDTCTCQCDDGNDCTQDNCSGQPNCTCTYERLTNSMCCDGIPIDPATQGCCDGEDIYMKRTQCCADGEVVDKKPIAFGDLLDCTDRIQCPTWRRQFDGCSLPASPGFDKDNPAGGSDTQFAVCAGRIDTCPGPRACDTHDICYQTCYPGGPGSLIIAKARCDVGMYRDMRATCAASQEGFFVRKACFDAADIYYIGLRLGGDYAFLSRQYNDVCQCCP
ncbi:MAG TPA: DNRLRE domain-containing protein [Thermoanaerobaculia bacterium]|nr:DNRLRE domain-containing protein [Thermoanaerobaculia bacterium]